MVTEIREYGDRERIIVYTDNPTVGARLAKWKRCLRVQEYCCGTWIKHATNWPIIAVDLYFPATLRTRICTDLTKLNTPYIANFETERVRKIGGQTALNLQK